jgi:hypothetical protein
LFAAAAFLSIAAAGASAQPRGDNAAPSARQAAPIDLTGYWVSVVTEDWRWRMLTPPPGDYASVPMTAAAREVAARWDREADARQGNECRPYGAGGIMRVPGRLHITWDNDNTLQVDTDAGRQTRVFHFGAFEPAAEPTWQGNSAAGWAFVGGGRGQPPAAGSLQVVTTGMKPGYLRWNGVPYSERALVTEHFDRYAAFDREWLTVTTIVDDPLYLTEPFIVTSDFVKEPNGSKWDPTPCTTDAPVRDRPAPEN